MPFSTMPERAIVIFLFAQEKLLFRYPLDNPFVIDMHTATSASMSSHRLPTDNPDATTTTTGAAGISTGTVSGTGGNESFSDTAVYSEPSTQKPQQQQQQQQQQVIPAASGGVGVRHKPRAAAQSRKSRQMQQQQQQQQAQSSGAAVSGLGSRDVEGSGTPAAKPSAPPLQSQSVEKVKTKSGAETCVGIQTHTLLHLLRASFSACTTIQFAGGTFLVYPLLPNDPSRRNSRPREAWNTPIDSTVDAPVAGMDANTSPNENNDNCRDSGKEEEGKRDARPSQGVLLVVAMNRPDRDDGAIASFVQLFMNVLVREEIHQGYATHQISAMERRLDAMEMGDTSHSAQKTSIIHNQTTGVAAGRLTATEIYARMLQDPQLPLCTELAQLARHITEADNDRTHSPGVCGADGGDTIGDMSSSSWRSASSVASVSPPPRRSRVTGAEAPRIVLRNLFALPPLLRRRARRGPNTVSSCARLNPNYLLALEDTNFVERLARGYVNAVGWPAAQLLPLAEVRAALAGLSRPWRVGALYRALEAAIASPGSQSSKMTQSGSTYNNNNSKNSNNNNNTNNSNSSMAAGNVSAWSTSWPDMSSPARNATDGAALAAEVVDFLHRSGALAVDTAVTVFFTHGSLCAVPHGSSSSSSSSLRVCPASLVASLLLSELRGTTSLSSPKTTRSDHATCVVRCAWGGACPLCEELAATCTSAYLSFPQLSASVRRAAARRAQQQQQQQRMGTVTTPVGRGEFDAERFSLLADQRPWFTHPGTFISPAPHPDRTPLQRYRQLTCEGIATHTERARDTTQTFLTRSDAEGGVVVELALGNIPHEARAWLAANRAVIEERLNAELQQRRAFEATRVGPCEASELLAGTVLFHTCRPHEASKPSRGKEAIDDDDERESQVSQEQTHTQTQTAEQPQETVPLDNVRAEGRRQQQRGKRYHKRAPFTFSSAADANASTAAAALSKSSPLLGSSSYSHPRESSEPARLTCTERVVPLEALMQFVLHHTVALLWGRERGMNAETLIRLLERNLRRLRPFLANYAYVQQQMALCAAPGEGSTAKLAEEPPHSVERHKETERRTPTRDALGELDAAVFGRELRESYEVFEALSLLDALRCLKGMAVDAVPTRLLLHAAVNAFSDVLLIGGRGPVSDGLQGR